MLNLIHKTLFLVNIQILQYVTNFKMQRNHDLIQLLQYTLFICGRKK